PTTIVMERGLRLTHRPFALFGLTAAAACFVHFKTDSESLSQAIHQILRSGIFHLPSSAGFSRRSLTKVAKQARSILTNESRYRILSANTSSAFGDTSSG